MKVRVYAIDLQLPRWLKRAILFGLVPTAALLGTVHYLRAEVPHRFKDQDLLSAAKLNDDFDYLEARIASLQASVSGNAIPAGTVAAFAGPSAPTGWLLCDGSAVSRAVYSSLFSAIGIAHGGGDGTSTFNLPDTRGRFLRGVDNGAGRDPDAASRPAPQAGSTTVTGGVGNLGDSVGSVQGKQVDSHQHSLASNLFPQSVAVWRDGIVASGSTGGWWAGIGIASSTTTSTPAATTTDTGGNETRPKNVYVNYIIKY